MRGKTSTMKVIVKNSVREASQTACQQVKSCILDKGYKVFGFGAGVSVLGLYAELAGSCRKGELDFSDLSVFNLDEFVGMAADFPQSRRFFLEANLFGHLNLKASNIHYLDGLTDSVEDECAYYEQDMEALGGAKLHVLELGVNGRIALNEPGTSMESRSHYVTLTETTRAECGRIFPRGEQVPRWGLTLGIGTILDAQELLVMACGNERAAAVREMLEGPVAQVCPASFLQLHQNVTVVLDAAAASQLTRGDCWSVHSDDYDEMMDFLMLSRRGCGLD